MSVETPEYLRARILALRAELAPAAVDEMSAQIQRRVMQLEAFLLARRIGLYADVDNEVRTAGLLHEARIHRKEVYYPDLADAVDDVHFYRVTAVADNVGRRHRLRDLNDLDMLIVTGVAFDVRGGRMGSGGGRIEGCLKRFRGERVGLCYDFQVLADLPHGVRTSRLDWIVTESRMIRCA